MGRARVVPTVMVEVMQGVVGEPCLVVNDTRVTGPRTGPYRTLYTFKVTEQDLLDALSKGRKPCK